MDMVTSPSICSTIPCPEGKIVLKESTKPGANGMSGIVKLARLMTQDGDAKLWVYADVDGG
jgi:hypothetical protein